MDISLPGVPSAPVFSPTIEEFSDPLSYLKIIYRVAHNYGICKIRPPAGWRPPFCADPLLFSFTPRLQNLAEVSAYNRSRNDFITAVVNFWEAQDVTVFAPYIKRRRLDLYCLWKAVQSNGGYQMVCEKKLWAAVSKSIGFGDVPHCAAAISAKYKKILLPYEVFILKQDVSEDDSAASRRKNQRSLSGSRRKQLAATLVCRICERGDNDACLLLCDGCETLGACHTYCLNPPLSDVPRGSWFCSACISRRFRRLQVNRPFGFIPSKKPRTLSKFNIYADEFKSSHFGKPAQMISTAEVESEFWRLLDDENTDVVVEYGADLSARDHGSGFPTTFAKLNGVGKFYVNSPWNLNNVAVSERSALRFLPKDISGMIIPWCYVGMVFSCFCWHTEDHWSYSINYLHTGSPKIWYGVPTAGADAFEAAMRAEIPELFKNSPDLLHHMTTMIPPEKVQAYGVPVYRLEQMAGEFVITFPRAYHAGFNEGFNFAEAVNFCPADWFELGQHSIDHYALNHRAPVFSHAELLCRMAASTEPLNVDFLLIVSKQLGNLLTTERSLRRHLARLGVRRAERMVFEETDDEKRECELCRTTLYLSALTCKCSMTMLCLAHHQARTCCPREEQVMRYRYGLDELSESINKLKMQLDEYRLWERRVTQCTATNATVDSSVAEPKAKSDEPLKDSSHQAGYNSVLLADSNEPPPLLESTEDEKTSINTDLNNDTAPDVISELVEFKPEDDWKPTVAELKDLVATGEARNYPQEMVNNLKRTIQTISECTSLIESIVANYRSSCDASMEQQADPSQKRSISEERCGKPTATVSGSSDDDETSAAEVVNEEDDVVATNDENRDRTESESDSTSSSSLSTDYENDAEHLDVIRDPSRKSLMSPLRELFSGTIYKEEPQPQPQKKHTPSNSPRTRSSPRLKPEQADSNRTVTVKNRPGRSKRQSASKLSFSEFSELLQTARRVRAYLPGWDELEQVSNHLMSWRTRAREIIASSNALVEMAPLLEELPAVKEVNQLIRFGDAINVDLDELKELRRLHEWLSWIESVESVLATAGCTDSSQIQSSAVKLSLDRLYLLQIQGSAMSAVITYSSFRASQRTGPWDQENWDEGPIPKIRIDRALHHTSERLLRVIYSARQSEAKLLAITKAKPYSLTLKDVLNEVQRLDSMPVSLPLAESIRKMCRKSELVAQEVAAIGKLLVSTPFGKQVPALDADRLPENLYDQLLFGTLDCTSAGWKTCLEELVEKVHDSPIRLPHIDRVRQLLDFVDHCRDRLVQLFTWPHSRLSLLELLLPRSSASLDSLLDVDTTSSETGTHEWESARPASVRRHSRASFLSAPTYALLCKENAREFAKALVTCRDAGLLYDTIYRRYIETEQDLMIRLRASNTTKSHAKQQNSVIYCVCRKPGFAGFMLQCELCRDWFHGKCVCLPNLKDSETERLRYMCPRCERSLRPDLNQVLLVLDDLIQALPIERSEGESTDGAHANTTSANRLMCLLRLPEFVAVQLLCERAFLFIRHLRETILSTPELYRAIIEYEQFAGVKMPLDTYTEENCLSVDSAQSDSVGVCQLSEMGHRSSFSEGTNPPPSRALKQSERHFNTTGRVRDAHSSKQLEEEAMLAAREINDLSTEYSYRPQDPNILNLMMMRKQTRKAPLVTRGTVSNQLDAGQEAEAAEALAGMSSSVFRGGVTSSERSRPLGVHAESRQRPVGNSLVPRSTPSIECRSMGSRLGTKPVRGGSGRSGLSAAYMPVRRDASGGSCSDLVNSTSKWKEENMEPNAKNCPSSSMSQSTYTPSNAVTKFRFVLSPGARDVLESLIMEACLLEINVPQTRWLWQLHLASDPEADVGGGAYPPPLARAEEEKMKRRFLRHLNRVKCGGKRRRQARQNSDSTTEEGSVDSENEMVASGVRGERNTEDVSPSHSDTASTLCSTRSTSDRQAYGQFETRRSNSSSRLNEMTTSRPRSVTNRPHDGTVRRKPYRPRGGVTVGTVSRRHDLTHEKRFQATKKRRSLNRPVLSSTAGGRFGVHYPSARYMNMKLYRQRLVSINQNSGSTEARLRYTRFTSSEGPVRSRRPRRGVAADRVTYRIPETPYTSDSEDSSVAAEEAHYRGPSESNAVEQRARQTAGPPRRRRMGRSNVFQSSRPSRRMPRDRNEMDETLLNRKRGRRQSVAVGAGGIGWPAPEANTMGTESDSESTAPDRSDECAARPCENPRTGTVEWIACDGCGRWFHQLCVGIRHRSQVPEVYECPRCSRISSLQVRDILSVHRERVRDRRMRNLPALNAPASSIASSTHAVSTTQPGPLSMTAAPPMRMREFHYSDNARARSSHLSYMAVQRPIGWNASTTPNTLLGSVRSSTDLLHTISRIRTSSTHHHLAMGSGPIPYEHVTERPLAAAVADQWVADYPHSPGTDELDSSVTDPTHGTAESVRSEGGSRISDPIVHTPQTSHSDELTEAAPYDTRMNVPDSLQTASKGPTEVLLEAIEVLSGAVDSNCSPETTT